MRFVLVLALFSIPLVYAGLGNLGGISHLMEQQRLGKVAADNTPAASILAEATIPVSTKVDDEIGLVSNGSAVYVPDPAGAFNKASTVFANAQLTKNPPLNTTEIKAALEDSTAARFLTGTTHSPNPEEIIRLGVPRRHTCISLRNAKPLT